MATASPRNGIAIEAALERSGVSAEQVQQVIFGQVLQAGQGQIPSRQAQIKGGIPKEVSSETINKVCASGMRSLGLADQGIRAGDLDIAVTGGMESMSKAPYLLPNARFGFRMGDVQALDAMTHDGLTNAFTGKQMINEASEVSNELEITRADMDKFAVRSQTLAGEARRHGADGVICGHIHYATIRDEHGIRYMNCGDWVESCTALAEHEDGRFEIITWTDPLRRTATVPAITTARAA